MGGQRPGLEAGILRLGGWRLEAGGWRLEAGDWWLELIGLEALAGVPKGNLQPDRHQPPATSLRPDPVSGQRAGSIESTFRIFVFG
jgi:hypothetical protein